MPADRKPILAIDFDGVIHRYRRGWQDGRIYDPVTAGFFEWAIQADKLFTLVIHSSRAKDQMAEMRDWLGVQWENWLRKTDYDGEMPTFEITAVKPPAWLTIDDRCVRFDGHWNEAELRPELLQMYKPWNQRNGGGHNR
jgi:hypothetical protein